MNATSTSPPNHAAQTQTVADTLKLERVQLGVPQKTGFALVRMGPRLDVPSEDNTSTELRHIVVGRGTRQRATVAWIQKQPLVAELTWKRLCIGLERFHRPQKQQLLQCLVFPATEATSRMNLTQVRAPLRDLWVQAQRELQDRDNNPAIRDARLAARLSRLSEQFLAPAFPLVYLTAVAQDPHALIDPHVAPMWVQITMRQHAPSYYDDVLAMQHPIDAEMLLAHLFQIVFALNVAQDCCGLVHHDLDVSRALSYVHVDPCTHLDYQWHGRRFRVPTFGRIVKIGRLETATLQTPRVLRGSQSPCGLDTSSTHATNTTNFNLDLVRCAATLAAALRCKQVVCQRDPRLVDSLHALLSDWISTCLVDDDQQPQACTRQMVDYRRRCLERPIPADGRCLDWLAFFQMPSHRSCNHAVPSRQVERFPFFQVDRGVPPTTHLYVWPLT